VTLDVFRVGSQLAAMGQELRDHREARAARLSAARGVFARLSDDWERMASAARSGDRSGAAPLGPLSSASDRGAAPPSYLVMATDGSTIEPDRHGPAMCALVNIGRARIRYGDAPEAELDSEPILYFRREELFIEQGGRRVLLRQRLLDARRSVLEMEALSEMARDANPLALPSVALADGLLTIWREDWATQDGDEVIAQFNRALARIADVKLPLAAYVSNPSSHWVVDLLRSAVQCVKGCGALCQETGCVFGGLVDAELYRFLQPGQASTLFEVVGPDQHRYDERVRSHFFYLNVGREIVRVEVPAWVARDEDARRLVHNVVFDQAERGLGYPVALARAHEQAVISGRDRLAFQQLVIESLTRAGLGAGVSEKQASKTLRAV